MQTLKLNYSWDWLSSLHFDKEPFTVSLQQISDTDLGRAELLNPHNNQKLCFYFESMKLDWLLQKLGEAYSILTIQAYQTLVPICHNLPLWIKHKQQTKAEHDRSVALLKMCMSIKKGSESLT
jgi:hypothetical protein